MSKFWHDNDNTKATAMPWVFSENSRANTCWKRNKCWLPAFSPSPKMFSKALVLQVVQTRDCLW